MWLRSRTSSTASGRTTAGQSATSLPMPCPPMATTTTVPPGRPPHLVPGHTEVHLGTDPLKAMPLNDRTYTTPIGGGFSTVRVIVNGSLLAWLGDIVNVTRPDCADDADLVRLHLPVLLLTTPGPGSADPPVRLAPKAHGSKGRAPLLHAEPHLRSPRPVPCGRRQWSVFGLSHGARKGEGSLVMQTLPVATTPRGRSPHGASPVSRFHALMCPVLGTALGPLEK